MAARKKTTRKKAAKRTTRKKLPGKRTRRKRPCVADCPTVVVEELGRAKVIEYERGGKVYRHTFRSKAAKVYATIDGTQVVIAPAKVRGSFIHG